MRTLDAYPGYPLAFRRPDYVVSLTLSAGVAVQVNVPSFVNAGGATVSASLVAFASTCDIFVGYGVAASLPPSGGSDGTGCELNPQMRLISGDSFVSLVSRSGGDVTLAFYQG